MKDIRIRERIKKIKTKIKVMVNDKHQATTFLKTIPKLQSSNSPKIIKPLKILNIQP